MNFRTLIFIGVLGLLGFFLFPRSGPESPQMQSEHWVSTLRLVPDEPLHALPMYRTDPVVATYDLEFVYRLDRTLVSFKDPENRGPRRYTILGSLNRSGPYRPLFSYHGYSDEYRQGVLPFPEPAEARWLQLVIEDWGNQKPQLLTKEFKVGASYPPPGPVQQIETNVNVQEAGLLIDGLLDQVWRGGEPRRQNDQVEYRPPRKGQEVWIRLDLGDIQTISEVRVIAKDASAQLKRYGLSFHTPEQRDLAQITVTPEAGEPVSRTPVRVRARFITLTIPAGQWPGDYPELREIQIFTRSHRPLPSNLPSIENYNAVQVYYENAGYRGEFSPHLVQGFPYDRGEGVQAPERYFWREDLLEPGASPAEKSFAYHYHELVFRFDRLDPAALYWVQVTYLQEKAGTRVQRLKLGDYVAHGAASPETNEPFPTDPWVPGRGKPERLMFAVPRDAYADGSLEVRITRLRGPNAVVSTLALFEARETPTTARASELAIPRGQATQAIQPPVIDGELEEWPRLYPLTSDDGRVQLYLQWDQANLYLAGQIRGRNGRSANPRTDQLHVFLDAAGRRSPGMFTASDHHFVLSRGEPPDRLRVGQIHHHMDALSASVPDHRDAEGAIRQTDDGYTFEVRLPLGTVVRELIPQAGRVLGFNYVLYRLNAEPSFWVTSDLQAPPAQWGLVRLLSPTQASLSLLDPTTGEPISQFSAGEPLLIAVRDPDRNQDPKRVETVSVQVEGNRTGDRRTLQLVESTLEALLDADPSNDQARDSELFAARMPTTYGTHPAPEPIRAETPFVVQGDEIVRLSYRDPYFSPTQREQVVTAQIQVKTGSTGVLHVLDSSGTPLPTTVRGAQDVPVTDEAGRPIPLLRAGQRLLLIVQDADLIPSESAPSSGNAQPPSDAADATPERPTLTITVRVASTQESEQVILNYVPESQDYRGELPTAYAEQPTPGDGVLQVAGAQQVVATYLDRIQDTGRTQVPVVRRLLVLAGHTAFLTILPGPGIFVREGMHVFNAGTILTVHLEDADLNQDPAAREEARLQVQGDTVHDSLEITLRETSENSGIFLGTVKTAYAEQAVDDEVLQGVGGETFTLTYLDALQGTGATQVPVEETVRMNTGADGTLAIVHADLTDLERFNAGDVLYFSVDDPDLTERQVSLRVEGRALGDRVELTLLRSAVGTYTAPLKTAYAEEARPDDNVLQVRGGEEIVATYVDALRSNGATQIAVEDHALVNVGTTGTLEVYAEESLDRPIMQFVAGQSLRIRVSDADLNANSNQIETTFVQVAFYPTGSVADLPREQMEVILQEVSGNAGVFEGILQTAYGEQADPTDERLQVEGYGSVQITYLDAIQETGRTQVPLAVTLAVATGQTGYLQLRKADDSGPLSSLTAGDRVLVKLNDNDLNREPQRREWAEITAEGNVFHDQVILRLQETGPDTGEFWGTLQTQDVSQEPDRVDFSDEVLQVRDKEVVRVIYRDALTSRGEPGRLIEVRALVASSSPGLLLIVDERGVEIGQFRAGDPIVIHLQDLLLMTARGAREVTVEVSGNRTNDYVLARLRLIPGSEGVYEGMVATRYGTTPTYDEVLDVQGGEVVTALYRPEFLGIPDLVVTDTAVVARGTRGRLTITRADGSELIHFTPGARLYFRLEDPDLNEDPLSVENAVILVGTRSAGPLRRVRLQEIAPAAGVFTGSLPTAFGQSEEGLGLSGGETVEATYRDPLTDTGETNVPITDTCAVNAVGYASYARDPIAVDGHNDRWDLNNPLSTPNEEAMVWVEWDANNLYLFARIDDTQVEVEDPTRWYERADALEIHLDLDPDDQGRPRYIPSNSKPFVFWFCPKGGGPDGLQPYAGRASPSLVWNYAPPLKVARIFRKTYYTFEIAIPFSVLGGFDPSKSRRYRRIGFNYIVYRSDGPQIQWAQVEGIDDQTPPSQLGTLYFREP